MMQVAAALRALTRPPASASRLAALLCLATGLGLLSPSAQANWLSEQWKHFQSYPRLSRAYSQIAKGDLGAARQLLEEVRDINPRQRDAALALADICSRQADEACVQELAADWWQLAPTDAMGPMLDALAAYLRQDDAALIKHAQEALQRPGLSEEIRIKLIQGWLSAAQGLGEAESWQRARQQAQALGMAPDESWLKPQAKPDRQQAQAAPLQVAAATKPAPPQPAPSVAARPGPAARPAAPAQAGFPYAELSPQQRLTLLARDFKQSAEQGRFDSLKQSLDRLRQAGLYDAQVQRLIANLLQDKNCSLLLEEVPVERRPEASSYRAQMAAGYCAMQADAPEGQASDPLRAAQHFEAAGLRRQDPSKPPPLAALRGETQAWLAAADVPRALRSGRALLSQEDDRALALELAGRALQLPFDAQSLAFARQFPQYLPPAKLSLQQARHWREQGQPGPAESAYRQSLRESPDADVWYELAQLMRLQRRDQAVGEALESAVALAPEQDLYRAEFGYWLMQSGQAEAALAQMQAALRLRPERSELHLECAALLQRLGREPEAALELRAAIDAKAQTLSRLGLRGEAAEQSLFSWQRQVQHLEDRWRLDLNLQFQKRQSDAAQEVQGRRYRQARDPLQDEDYGNSLDASAVYRLQPIWDAAHPSWAQLRYSQGLNDNILGAVTEDRVLALGLRQSLLKDRVLIASSEWIYRSNSRKAHDLMLRLSSSNSAGGDWQPLADAWAWHNVFTDAAWLALSRSYYLALKAEWGRFFRLPFEGRQISLLPYGLGKFDANNDNDLGKHESRVDIGVGLAWQIWSGGDPWRAPHRFHRLALEWRQAVAGNEGRGSVLQLSWRFAQ